MVLVSCQVSAKELARELAALRARHEADAAELAAARARLGEGGGRFDELRSEAAATREELRRSQDDLAEAKHQLNELRLVQVVKEGGAGTEGLGGAWAGFL